MGLAPALSFPVTWPRFDEVTAHVQGFFIVASRAGLILIVYPLGGHSVGPTKELPLPTTLHGEASPTSLVYLGTCRSGASGAGAGRQAFLQAPGGPPTSGNGWAPVAPSSLLSATDTNCPCTSLQLDRRTRALALGREGKHRPNPHVFAKEEQCSGVDTGLPASKQAGLWPWVSGY